MRPLPTDPEALAAWIDETTAALEALADDRTLLLSVERDQRKRFLAAAGRVAHPSHEEKRELRRTNRRTDRRERRETDRELLARTGIRVHRANPIFETPRRLGTDHPEAPSEPIGDLSEPRNCYVCRAPYRRVHPFYDQLCVPCGDRSFAKRSQTADLHGRVALLTGGRVKIGYQTGILLLRAGCRLVVTTRFPQDAARRYAAESDFEEWRDRLIIHGVDLRHTPSVETLCSHLLGELDRLDFLVNNACQTVRRPAGFYDHLLAGELEDGGDPSATALVASQTPSALPVSAALTQVPLLGEDLLRGGALFPEGLLDADLQQVDLRRINSWRLKLAEISTVEMLEVQLVNAVAPFVLAARLKPLMLRVPTRDKHVVNVSAMEGQFYRTHKTDRHPHTNMAKAALNMMTRTAALDYIEDGIHMNSVDTGWVTDEDPAEKAAEKRDMHNFHPPLDIVDGAARICDPIFDGFNTGVHVWGQFLKDFAPTDW